METRIELLAIAPDDGWGFIKIDNQIKLIQPPYSDADIFVLAEDAVAKSVDLYGFNYCNKSFENILEVIAFLEDQYVKSKESAGITLPSLEEIKKLLVYANKDVIRRYIKRINDELLPKFKFSSASYLASELLKLEKVRKSPEMVIQLADVLQLQNQRCAALKLLYQNTVDQVIQSWSSRFHNAVENYTLQDLAKTQKKLYEAGQIIPMGLN